MKAVSINELPPHLQEQVRKQLAGDRPAGKTAKLESVIGDGPLAKEGAKGCDGQVDIRIHSKLKRLRDADGTSGKYAIDALVSCGILKGDGPEQVREVSHSQEKSDKEETIITITW